MLKQPGLSLEKDYTDEKCRSYFSTRHSQISSKSTKEKAIYKASGSVMSTCKFKTSWLASGYVDVSKRSLALTNLSFLFTGDLESGNCNNVKFLMSRSGYIVSENNG